MPLVVKKQDAYKQNWKIRTRHETFSEKTCWKLNQVNPDSCPWLVPYVSLVIKAGGGENIYLQDTLCLSAA